ncbi:MAG: hypothetical protein RL323_2025 [Pseudomonadota bacterium]
MSWNCKCALVAPGLGGVWACLLALPGLLWAQTEPSDARNWRSANEAVGQFPRGHADVLKWEQRQPTLPLVGQSEPVPDGLALPTPEAAVRQAWKAHRDLAFVVARLGAAHTNRVAAGLWLELPPQLVRRVHGLDELLAVAVQARKGWLEAVAARHVLKHHQTAFEAAEAAQELGQRMLAVGNWSQLQHAQTQLAHAGAKINLQRARYAAAQAQASLIKLLGVSGVYSALNLPSNLPDLPQVVLSPAQVSERMAALQTQLPRAEAMQNQALTPLAFQAYQASHAIAVTSAQGVLQTRERITAETVLHYNGMLKSVWDLLSETRNQAQAAADAVNAQRDFALAETDLHWVLLGGQPQRFINLGAGGADAAATAAH